MTLRRKFVTFAVLIHLILAALALVLLFQNKLLFVAAELLIAISIPISIRLYKSFLKPLDLLAAGVDSIRSRDFSTTFVPTGHDELDQLVDIYNRMIAQLRDERIKQQQQNFFLQRLVDATPIGVLILDLAGRIEIVNPAAQAMLAGESGDLIGRALDSLQHPPANAFAALKPGETRTIDVNGMRIYKCRKSHFADRGFYRHFIMIEELTPDILTTQKKAYDKVIRMMSHEINNTVGAVNSILQSARHYTAQLGAADRHDFEDAIQVAMERNSGLNKFMANLANVVRTPPPVQDEEDLNAIVNSVCILLVPMCKLRRITCTTELADNPLAVHVDLQQIEQVLVNVIKNAAESIGQEGTIVIRTTAGEPVTLRVIDDGPGIPDAVRPHLFTPFYSTKKDGQGIGLTLIREILINHGCRFNLEQTAPRHTEFWIEFPRRPD